MKMNSVKVGAVCLMVILLGTAPVGIAKKKTDFEEFPASEAPGIEIAISHANDNAVFKRFGEREDDNTQTISDPLDGVGRENEVLGETVEQPLDEAQENQDLLEDTPNDGEPVPAENELLLETENQEVVEEESAVSLLPTDDFVEESSDLIVMETRDVQQVVITPPQTFYSSAVYRPVISFPGTPAPAVTPADNVDIQQTTHGTEEAPPATPADVPQATLTGDKTSGLTATVSNDGKLEISPALAPTTGFGLAFVALIGMSVLLRLLLASSWGIGRCFFQADGKMGGLRGIPSPEKPKRPFRLFSRGPFTWDKFGRR
ncbi:MAG: hypothetical protein QW179_00225 [Candidatus Hadarchaeales archaeon]